MNSSRTIVDASEQHPAGAFPTGDGTGRRAGRQASRQQPTRGHRPVLRASGDAAFLTRATRRLAAAAVGSTRSTQSLARHLAEVARVLED